MKRLLIFAASAVAVLASCTQNDEFASPVANDEVPVTFGTYTSILTRAGETGSIAAGDGLKDTKGGFGVYAYYTKSTAYTAGQDAFTPDFMYNQQVKWTTKWEYSPLKYWPNANTTADDQNPAAVGTEGGLVSFFAYAPYVKADASGTTSDVDGVTANSTGITKVTGNAVKGDPKLTYKIDPAGNNVDLLWGTSGTESSIAGTTTGQSNEDAANTGQTLSGGKGKVNANLTKQTVDGSIKFNFKHALAKLGGAQVGSGSANGLQVKLDVDAIQDGTLDTENTRVTIQSITITNDLDGDGEVDDDEKSIADGGELNLATGVWTPSTTYTIIKNVIGTETTEGKNATLKEALQYSPISGSDFDATHTGVTVEAQNVYAEETNPIVLIPGTIPTFNIKIVYNVTTKDGALATGFSDVQNTITKKITFTKAVEMNKMYNFLLRLGLTSVKVEATVSDWDVDSTTSGDPATTTTTTQEVNLPINVE